MINPTTTHGKHEAAAETYGRKIITLTGNQLVTKCDGEKYSQTVAVDATVTRAGRPCKIEDLKLGNDVRITTRKDDPNVVIRIECLQGG